MSCVRITTDAMRNQLKCALSDDSPVAQFLSPQVTQAKIDRVKKLAKDKRHKIRESAALSYHAPDSVYRELSNDPIQSVRECLARNINIPGDVIDKLSKDDSERVRAFIASNKSTPLDIMEKMLEDESELVRNVASLYISQ